MTFGRNDSKKVSNNICFLPLYLTNTSTIPGETGNRLHIFTSMLHAVLQKNARNTLRYNKWSQLSKRLTVCSRQDPWEGDLASCSILPSPLTLDVYQVCHCVGRCVKDRSCSSSSIEWKSIGRLLGLLSQQMLVAVKRVVRKNFVFQQDSASVHHAFNIVQLLRYKTLNFLSSDLWPRNSR